MRGKVLTVLTLLIPTIALAGQSPTKAPTQAQKKAELERIKEKLQQIVAPEYIYRDKDLEDYEKAVENLRRQKTLLELQKDIIKTQAEIEKLRRAMLPPPPQPQPTPPQPQPTKERTKVEKGPAQNFQLEFYKLQLKKRELERKKVELSQLLNLFTGVAEVGGKKVAFDKFGKKYTVGSYVNGFKIVDISDTGITVADSTGETYVVPLASAEVKEKNAQSPFGPPPTETPELAPPPPPVEQPPLPIGG